MSSSSSSLLLLLVIIIINVISINSYVIPINRINRNNNVLKSEIIERTTQQPIDITTTTTYNDMKTYQLKSINEYDFDEYIEDKHVTVCLFQAPWAGPCKTMEKTLITEIMPNHDHEDIQFVKIDTDNSYDLVHSMSIRSIPSIIIFKNGKIVSEIIGAVSADVVNYHLADNNESYQ